MLMMTLNGAMMTGDYSDNYCDRWCRRHCALCWHQLAIFWAKCGEIECSPHHPTYAHFPRHTNVRVIHTLNVVISAHCVHTGLLSP